MDNVGNCKIGWMESEQLQRGKAFLVWNRGEIRERRRGSNNDDRTIS